MMTEPISNWLPEEAFADDAIRSVLTDPVACWLECWFARVKGVVSAIHKEPARWDGGSAQNLRVEKEFVRAELPGPGKRLLLEAALGVDLSGQTLNEKDHRVLDALAAHIVEDLTARLEEYFGGETVSRAGSEIGVTLSIAGSDILFVTIPRHVFIPMLKSRFGNAKPPRGAFVNRLQALKPTRVTAEGFLGRAELTMDDLKGLAAGDVLVLDKSLHEPVELRLTGSNRHVGAGRLVQNGGKISIQL